MTQNSRQKDHQGQEAGGLRKGHAEEKRGPNTVIMENLKITQDELEATRRKERPLEPSIKTKCYSKKNYHHSKLL